MAGLEWDEPAERERAQSLRESELREAEFKRDVIQHVRSARIPSGT